MIDWYRLCGDIAPQLATALSGHLADDVARVAVSAAGGTPGTHEENIELIVNAALDQDKTKILTMQDAIDIW